MKKIPQSLVDKNEIKVISLVLYNKKKYPFFLFQYMHAYKLKQYKYTVIVIYIVQWKLYINHKIEIYTDIYMGAYISIIWVFLITFINVQIYMTVCEDIINMC